MMCPFCGANIEITELPDGSILIRQDCKCNLNDYETIPAKNRLTWEEKNAECFAPAVDLVKSSQLGFEVPEDVPRKSKEDT